MAAACVNAELDIDTADLLRAVLTENRGKFFDVEIALEGIF